jgi:quinol monooxygenase YgiN
MVTEIALFTALPGKEDELGQAIMRGMEVIRQHPDCIEARLERCIERSDLYMLVNTWTSLHAHTQSFRGGPLFLQWRSHINGLFVDPPGVFHYQVVEKE